eukprot:m.136149 g.136149  ORF g.136149 m.136149 type:complete len:2171 (+) comp9899_c1_seq4:74-6586(+)
MPLFVPKRSPVDWQAIKDAKIDALLITENEEDVAVLDELYPMLIKADPGFPNRRDSLNLFRITQMALELKGEDNKLLEVELAKADAKIQELTRKVEGTGQQQEILELRHQIEKGALEQQQLNDDIARHKEEIELLQEQLNEKGHQLVDAQSHSERLQDDIKELHHQMELLRQSTAIQHGDLVHKEALDKQRQLANALSTLDEANEQNRHLAQQVAELTSSLQQSVQSMEQSAERIEELEQALFDSDSKNEELTRERDILHSRLEDVLGSLQNKVQSDDQIMVSVSETVETWKHLLSEKDAELNAAHQVIKNLKHDLEIGAAKRQTNIEAQLQAKTNEIEALREKLARATDDIKLLTQDATASRSVMESYHDPQHSETLEELRRAHNQLEEKDHELVELLKRMDEYEQNVYGLHEAVKEIKHCKGQIAVRDADITKLTREINSMDKQLGELSDENEELRRRCGLDPSSSVDLAGLRHRRNVELEQLRAMNRLLSKDIDKLEAERLELKQKLIAQAMDRGERAVDLGLTSADLSIVEDLADHMTSSGHHPQSRTKQLQTQVDELHAEKRVLEQQLLQHRQDFTRPDAISSHKVIELENENKELRQGLREIGKKLGSSEHSGASVHPEVLVVVNHLLEVLDGHGTAARSEERAALGKLQGANEELRSNLTAAQEALMQKTAQVERQQLQLLEVQDQLSQWQQRYKSGVPQQLLQLPEHIAPSSVDVIGFLNTHLLETLHELDENRAQLESTEQQLQEYKRKFSTLAHQQGQLYDEHVAVRKTISERDETMAEMQQRLDDAIQKASIFEREFQIFSEGPHADAAELARQLAVHKVNEALLIRRYDLSTDVETRMRKENEKLRGDFDVMEAEVTKRIGYLERFKEASSFKINSLQSALLNSVDREELESMNRRYSQLAGRYRALLERINGKNTAELSYESLLHQCRILKLENESLFKQLEFSKERSAQLLSRLEGELPKEAFDAVTLELRATNERQRAELLTSQKHRAEETISELEQRNLELEQKFSDLTEKHIALSDAERNAKLQLEHAISPDMAERLRADAARLEGHLVESQTENSRLQELVDIATHQTDRAAAVKATETKELESLRRQLIDFQMQSEDNLNVGKLHHHILALQMSEAEAVRKLDLNRSKVLEQEAALLRLEERCDKKDDALQSTRAESHEKIKMLFRSLQDLRAQYSGALPLDKQEQFAQTLQDARDKKHALELEVNLAVQKRAEVEDQLACLDLEHKMLQELLETLRNNTGAQKVVEWHGKMAEVRLSELRLQRGLSRKTEEANYLQKVLDEREHTIRLLEQSQVETLRRIEQRQLAWEEREIELERLNNEAADRLLTLERNIANAASSVENGDFLPDPSLPIAHQLEDAINKLKLLSVQLIETKAAHRAALDKHEDHDFSRRRLEAQLYEKDALVSQLRAVAGIRGQGGNVSSSFSALITPDLEHAHHVASETINALRAVLDQKEHALEQARRDLTLAHEEFASARERHSSEIDKLQDKILQLQRKRVALDGDDLALNGDGRRSRRDGNSEVSQQLLLLQEELSQREHSLRIAKDELKHVRQQLRDAQANAQRLVDSATEQSVRRRQEAEKRADSLQSQNSELLSRVAVLERELDLRQARISDLNAEIESIPVAQLMEEKEQLMERQAKQDQVVKKLKSALQQARESLGSQAVAAAQARSPPANDALFQQAEGLQARMLELQNRLKSTQDAVARYKSKIQQLEDQLQAKQKELDAKSRKLKTKHAELESNAEAHREELLAAQRRHTEELELLRQELQSMHASALTRGFEHDARQPEEAMDRWHFEKKLNRKVEVLKAKLAEGQEKITELERQVGNHRGTISRLDRERAQLQSKLRRQAEEHERQTSELQKALDEFSANQGSPARATPQQLRALQQNNEALQVQCFFLREMQLIFLNQAEKERLQRQLKAKSRSKEKLETELKDVKDQPGMAKLAVEHERVRGLLRKETARADKLQKQLVLLQSEVETLRNASDTGTRAIERSENELRLRSSLLEAQLERLQKQLAQREDELDEANEKIRLAIEHEQQLLARYRELEEQLAAGEAGETEHYLAIIRRLEQERDELRIAIARVAGDVRSNGSLGLLKAEHEKLQAENRELRAELQAFDPSFFQEIEELKESYQEALRRNAEFERELAQLRRR